MHRLLRHSLSGLPARAIRRRRRGQALVEFAIVAPVMVTTLLFAIYFYELVQIKLKTQEIARFAAWEFTGHPLHDYETGKTDQFGNAQSAILEDANRRYANLKGGDTGNQDRILAVSWSPPRIRARDQLEPSIPGGNLVNMAFNVVTRLIDLWSMQAYTHGNWVLAIMMGLHQIENQTIFGARASRFNPPRRWGFNTKGYPKVTVSLRYNNLMIPRSFMEGNTGWYKAQHFKISQRSFTETVAVVADSWRLHRGDDINGPKDKHDASSKAYFKQVDRMAFVTPTIRTTVNSAFQFATLIMAAIQLAAFQPPLTMNPTETTLVSIAYGRDGSNESKGVVSITEDQDTNKYDTMPFKQDSEYEKSFEKRGTHFMGCNDPEQLGCFDSASKDNPFGDFVEPPPETP